jgi:hypothetical protein
MYRAYDQNTGWQGQPHKRIKGAMRDALLHNDGCAYQGGYGSAIVVTRDSDGFLVTLEGKLIWPSHGRSNGAVRWIEEI